MTKSILTLTAIMAALGFGWWLGNRAGAPDLRETLPTEPPARDAKIVMVSVEPITTREVRRSVEAVGTLHAFEEITLSSKVEGRVRQVQHDVADRVKPGEVILEIDPTDYELTYKQAEWALLVELAKLGLKAQPDAKFDVATVPMVAHAKARMDHSQAKLKRVSVLAVSRSISPDELEAANADFQMAQADHANQVVQAKSSLATVQMKQAALAIAKQQCKDSKILAPVPLLATPSGCENVIYGITHRNVAEGTYVRPGTEVAKLVIDCTLKLRVPVPERHSADIRFGQSAELYLASSSKPFVGTVTRIRPSIEPTTRTFEVEIQVPNPARELKSGGFAKAAILTRVDPNAITVPLNALVSFAGITKIFIEENGRAKEVQVTLGVQTSDWVEIATPALKAGTRVITSGQALLANETPVSVRGN